MGRDRRHLQAVVEDGHRNELIELLSNLIINRYHLVFR